MVDAPFLSSIDVGFLEKELEQAEYDPALGIRRIDLSKTVIGNIPISLIVIKLDPGKQLIPHLHIKGGEICLPITHGLLRLGKAQKDQKGEYIINEERKAIVNWDKPFDLTPMKALEIHEGTPHHLYAPDGKPFILMFFLPTDHLSTNRMFTTYP